jgi:hypothetical protein
MRLRIRALGGLRAQRCRAAEQSEGRDPHRQFAREFHSGTQSILYGLPAQIKCLSWLDADRLFGAAGCPHNLHLQIFYRAD